MPIAVARSEGDDAAEKTPIGEEAPITIRDLEDLMADLRGIAHNLLQCESDAASVRPTALVISGLRRYKLSDQDWGEISWENRSHFFKSTYMMMRRALIDHARRRQAEKRPKLLASEEEALDLFNLAHTADHTPDRVIALDEALGRLSVENNELAVIVQHHYFSGLSVEEISKVVGGSQRTIKRRLADARVALAREIGILMGGS